ncbi:hypothetical protein ED28_03135 [[Pantoea] beijingensis]|uniref:Uncharacterized protein n=1 Tax=[Pantoea] beijingensis TaxID=1324864 RepID=A0A443IGU0_9GAMM|nr:MULTISPECIES: hypothetical protein [Erwiniaceae]RWR03305.1 hypothetical protein ED28_03135 [[Pantoea] beijingensis]
MKIFNLFLGWWLTLAAVVMPFPLYAEQISEGLPFLKPDVVLSTPDTITREVAVGKIMSQVKGDFRGRILLIWNNSRFNESANKLRSDLIQRGIAPYRIELVQDVGGYRKYNNSGIKIHIQQMIKQQRECQDKNYNYKFNRYSDQGCALGNLLDRSLVDIY